MGFFDLAAIAEKTPLAGIRLKAVSGEKVMMAFFDLDAGAALPMHQHPHEQMGVVMSGELTLTIGDETKACRAGDTYLIPPNTPHGANVPPSGPAKVLDIFSPPREDYRN